MLILTTDGLTQGLSQLDLFHLYVRHSSRLMATAIKEDARGGRTFRVDCLLNSSWVRVVDYETAQGRFDMAQARKRSEVVFARQPKPDAPAKRVIVEEAENADGLLKWFEQMVVTGYRVGCSWSKDQQCYVAFATGISTGDNMDVSLTMRGKSVRTALASLKWAVDSFYGGGKWSLEKRDDDIV